MIQYHYAHLTFSEEVANTYFTTLFTTIIYTFCNHHGFKSLYLLAEQHGWIAADMHVKTRLNRAVDTAKATSEQTAKWDVHPISWVFICYGNVRIWHVLSLLTHLLSEKSKFPHCWFIPDREVYILIVFLLPSWQYLPFLLLLFLSLFKK